MRFRGADPNRLHFAAHSHHLWPDVTREAQLMAWDDAAQLADGKWERVLNEVWTDVAVAIARHLRLPDPNTLVPAPNTHEFVKRLLSACPAGRPARVLATDGEFHSFRRQMERLREDGLVELELVPAEPFGSLQRRLAEAGAQADYDLVFVSQVLFGSGHAFHDLAGLVDALAAPDRMIAIDGYHGFLARPTDLSRIADRAFYLAGGYKYAMAGEGACFMHCPPGVAPRPRDTGWFASFATLTGRQAGVPYPEGGWRFMGATFDPSGLYRLRAVLRWLERDEIDASLIHAHGLSLQERFLAAIGREVMGPFAAENLVVPRETARGNFLAFEHPDAAGWAERLRRAKIVVDARGTRLRIGFGLYHAAEDVDSLVERLRVVATSPIGTCRP